MSLQAARKLARLRNRLTGSLDIGMGQPPHYCAGAHSLRLPRFRSAARVAFWLSRYCSSWTKRSLFLSSLRWQSNFERAVFVRLLPRPTSAGVGNQDHR